MRISVIRQTMKLCQKGLRVRKCFPAAFAVFLTCFSLCVSAQTIEVTGRVTNDRQEALPAVSVTIKGTTRGVTTNDSGSFRISVPRSATLVISSVGYSNAEVPVNSRTTIPVVLASAVATANEVIVVSYCICRSHGEQ